MPINNNNLHNYPELNIPTFTMRIFHGDGGIIRIFDTLRHKYVVLTPEEYVRQHFVNWLINYLHYPSSLMNNEVSLSLNGTLRRCDTIVFNPDSTPLMIIEYKAPGVEITQDVFDQIARYNMALQASFLIVSNGLRHFCCQIDYTHGSYKFLPSIPDYRVLTVKYNN